MKNRKKSIKINNTRKNKISDNNCYKNNIIRKIKNNPNSFAIIFTIIAFVILFSKTIYNEYLLDKYGVIVEAKITDKRWIYSYRSVMPQLTYVYTYEYEGVTYIKDTTIFNKKTEEGDCVLIIVYRQNPMIAKFYSKKCYKCDQNIK